MRGFRLSGGSASAVEPGSKMTQKRGLIFDLVLEPFWGPLGDPFVTMWDPWGPQGAKKRLKASPKRGLERVRKRDSKKSSILEPSREGSDELPPGREHSFACLTGFLLGPHFGPILAPFGKPFGAACGPRGLREPSEAPARLQKGDPKNILFLGPVLEPKWLQNIWGGFYNLGAREGSGGCPNPPWS